MSGPKCGSYTVVSAQELKRRRLSAARDRFERTVKALETLEAELNSAIATYGALDVGIPNYLGIKGEDAAKWEDASTLLSTEIESSRNSLESAIQAARVNRIVEASGTLTASLVGSVDTRVVLMARPEGGRDAEREVELLRVLGRLPSSATVSTVERCESLARGIRNQTSPADSDRMLNALRLVIQQEADRTELISSNTERLDRHYRELDGLRGQQVEALRGRLKAVARDRPLPTDLDERVQEVRRAAVAEADRVFVLEKVSASLLELGYEIGDEFSTAVAENGGIVELPFSDRHALNVRERDHQLMLNIVRYDESGRRDPAVDAHAEEQFCDDFSLLRQRLEQLGVDLSMVRADPPGAHPVQILRQAPPRRRRISQARPSLRKRDH